MRVVRCQVWIEWNKYKITAIESLHKQKITSKILYILEITGIYPELRVLWKKCLIAQTLYNALDKKNNKKRDSFYLSSNDSID